MWSPAFVIFNIEYVTAAAPDATARPATPPSSAATLFSNTSWVEFVNLPYIFPESSNPNLAAACALFLNTYDVVWYIGTALESVAGSGFSCPTCNCKVSNLTLWSLKIFLIYKKWYLPLPAENGKDRANLNWQ